MNPFLFQQNKTWAVINLGKIWGCCPYKILHCTGSASLSMWPSVSVVLSKKSVLGWFLTHSPQLQDCRPPATCGIGKAAVLNLCPPTPSPPDPLLSKFKYGSCRVRKKVPILLILCHVLMILSNLVQSWSWRIYSVSDKFFSGYSLMVLSILLWLSF